MDRTDSALYLWNLWPIRKERNKITIFGLGLVEGMFGIPRVCNGKLCARYEIRIRVIIDESVQEGSRPSEVRLAQSLLGLFEQDNIIFIGAGFRSRYLGISKAQRCAAKNDD